MKVQIAYVRGPSVVLALKENKMDGRILEKFTLHPLQL
jgi:hypothetical protein